MLHTKPERISLPLTATFLCSRIQDGFVAHSLDFDIVCVAETKEKAVSRLRESVKLYIEHGIQKRWEDDILFSAPEKYWARLTVETPICLMEPILIDDRTLRVFGAENVDEHQCAVGAV